MTAAPRQPAHAGHVPVVLKRKKEYKNVVHCPSFVNPKLLLESLNHFKEKGHPSYQDIDILSSFEPVLEFDPETAEENQDDNTKETGETSENNNKQSEVGLFLLNSLKGSISTFIVDLNFKFSLMVCKFKSNKLSFQ